MQCEVCGNEYAHAFTVVRNDERFVFDCFECAIHALAPNCAHCGCKIVGHGVGRDEEIFCCDHCLRMASSPDADDADEVEVELEVDESDGDDDDEDEEDDEDDDVDDDEDDDDELDGDDGDGEDRQGGADAIGTVRGRRR
jgi:hypothetical protein